ncbi:MAG: hypothetical protein CMO97_00110 [Woeseia sp.]|nr:hypothetical protein [Woeseia sp.]|tara:strand:+ start:176 stop:658 length:483 start_codon:yes stop_codon:yes gene_type:complete
MRLIKFFCLISLFLLVMACESVEKDSSDEAKLLSSNNNQIHLKSNEIASNAFEIKYDIQGKPIIGQAVSVKLIFDGSLESEQIQIEFKIEDPSSMIFSESQVEKINLQYNKIKNDNIFIQNVSIIPQKTGRIFLNVILSYEIKSGIVSIMKAIPIYVDSA